MSAVQDHLDAFVVGADIDLEGDDDIPPPTDAFGADRLLRAAGMLRRRIAEVRDVAERNIEQIANFRDERVHTYESRLGFVARSLEVWMRQRYTETNRTVKTEKLPHGTLEIRNRARSWHVTDEPAAVAFVREQKIDGGVRVKEEVAKSIVCDVFTVGPTAVAGPAPADEGYEWRACFTDDGEKVPGLLVLEPVDPKFNYKPKETTP